MENNYDAIFAAMADPTRRCVLSTLSRGPASVSDLHAPHAIKMPTFMKHLRKLEEAGLIQTHKSGRIRTVELDQNTMLVAENWISQQRNQWKQRLDRLEALAEKMDRTTS